MPRIKNIKLNNPIEKHFNVLTPYHYYFFSLIFLSKLPIFWHVLSLIFLSPPMDYYCNTTETNNISNDLKNVCPCKEPWWNRNVFTETVQTKFGLICESAWLISFSQSMLYMGTLFGALVFGFLSDKYGRLSTFTMSCLILAVSGCLVSSMPTAASFIVMRCIEGIGVGGAIVTAYVLCIEYCGVRHRETITALYHVPINLSHITLPGVSYLLRHCDEFQLALSIPVFLIVGFKWLIMESPKWLMDNDHIEQAAMVMEKLSKFNRTSGEIIKEEIEEFHSTHTSKNRRRMNFWHIFKHKRLVLNLGCMSIIYFTCGMGYYGVSQYIGKMSGDIHTNVAISGTLLLPGTITAIFLLKILNRRTFLMSTNLLSGIFMVIVICIPNHLAWVRVVFACICNCFFFMSFMIVFLCGVELFPTSIRNSVLGFLSVLSRLGQIVAPPINSLPELYSGITFGIMAILGAVLCYPLPETKNIELPSTLEDSRTLYRKAVNVGNQGKKISVEQ
ncbi:solute carrier family 22 member 3-like isoform X1 [Achroia grisella]|uniref:solute carrier family 22 member 3-like isoform X1 n=1 Tax=Achroia grisella TaxID=688607 RepID=UPI0027D27B5F|nr:solute carrier family 22 member 3-like isoform X1 [Achroia grisella]